MRVRGIEGEKERVMIERERERETERVQRWLRVNKLRQNVLRDQYSQYTYHRSFGGEGYLALCNPLIRKSKRQVRICLTYIDC